MSSAHHQALLRLVHYGQPLPGHSLRTQLRMLEAAMMRCPHGFSQWDTGCPRGLTEQRSSSLFQVFVVLSESFLSKGKKKKP